MLFINLTQRILENMKHLRTAWLSSSEVLNKATSAYALDEAMVNPLQHTLFGYER
jgi:hypothetical protein